VCYPTNGVEADKIIVLRQGKLVEEGSHEDLLKIENGVYHGLVHAQELALAAEEESEDPDVGIHKVKTAETERSSKSHKYEENKSAEDSEYKNRGLLNSFGRLIVEQRHHWILYTLTIIGILGAGAVYPLQAYLFANIVQVFTYTGQRFIDDGYFWSGMFGVEAAGVGLAYFTLGLCSHLISIVSRTPFLIRIFHRVLTEHH
jgi:ABC-type multidrug transport system fused ATPase/permease subunit